MHHHTPPPISGKPRYVSLYAHVKLALGGIAALSVEVVVENPCWTCFDNFCLFVCLFIKGQWYPTWKGEDAALQINSVTVFH